MTLLLMLLGWLMVWKLRLFVFRTQVQLHLHSWPTSLSPLQPPFYPIHLLPQSPQCGFAHCYYRAVARTACSAHRPFLSYSWLLPLHQPEAIFDRTQSQSRSCTAHCVAAAGADDGAPADRGTTTFDAAWWHGPPRLTHG